MSDSNTGDIRQNKKVQADRMEFKVLRQNRGSNYLNGISFPQYGCLFFKKLFPLLSLACFQFWSVYLLPFHLWEKQSNSIKTILISRLPFLFNILKKVLSFKASRYIYFTYTLWHLDAGHFYSYLWPHHVVIPIFPHKKGSDYLHSTTSFPSETLLQ